MKNGFMTDLELRPYLEKMHQCAEQMPVAIPFGIEDLLSAEEWKSVTLYGHITLGQLFRSHVDNGIIANVYPYGKTKTTQYIRR